LKFIQKDDNNILYFLSAKKDEADEKDKEEEKGSADTVVVLELLSLARPFTALRGVDIDALALKIINQLK
jgi:hypothetical protein